MSYQVLVVEDDDTLAILLQRKLGRKGHTVTVATNQQDAYHLLNTKHFDFALLDLRLPSNANDMDPNTEVGFAILQYIRQRFSSDRLPVIVMTAYEETSQTAVRALKLAANDYIQKPFEDSPVSLDEKLASITLHLGGPHAGGSIRDQRYKIVIKVDCVEIDNIPIANRHRDLLLVLASKTLMLTADKNCDSTTMKAREIAAALTINEDTVRVYVGRFRKFLAGEFLRRFQKTIDSQAIIRNTRDWSGYGLNFETAYLARE